MTFDARVTRRTSNSWFTMTLAGVCIAREINATNRIASAALAAIS